MNSLLLPTNIQNQTLTYDVKTPLAKGKLELKVERSPEGILVSGNTQLKAIGGFFTPLSADLRVLWEEQQSQLQIVSYLRKIKILKSEKNVETKDVPKNSIDHVSLIFGLQSHFEAHGVEPVLTQAFDGQRINSVFMALSKRGTNAHRQLLFSKSLKFSEENRLLAGLEVWVEESTLFVAKIGYALAGLGRIEITKA